MCKLKILLVFILIIGFNIIVYGQQNTQQQQGQTQQPQGQKTDQLAGDYINGIFYPKESSQQKLESILVDDFENCDSWHALMPPDQGYARAKKVLGAPEDVKKAYANRSSYVLGVKEWSYSLWF